MTRPVDIALPPEHRRLVLNILRANLPKSTKVWVFGSRATGRARRYSDLDLAIDASRPLTLDEIAGLAEAFSDSNLPYKVDLVDWHSIDDSWRQTITTERVALTEAAHPDGPGLSQSAGCAPNG
jgi:type I restriction enzyme S subunit